MNKNTGYRTNNYPFSTKKYCQVLDLKDDSKLIEEYKKIHSREGHWPIIVEGIRSIGVLEMELYLFENRLVMIVEPPEDFDWDSAFDKLNTLPRQKEWEDFVAGYQVCKEGSTSSEKWKMMERIFHLYE